MQMLRERERGWGRSLGLTGRGGVRALFQALLRVAARAGGKKVYETPTSLGKIHVSVLGTDLIEQTSATQPPLLCLLPPPPRFEILEIFKISNSLEVSRELWPPRPTAQNQLPHHEPSL